MTRAEAIKILERRTTIPGDGYTFEQINEALDLALLGDHEAAKRLTDAGVLIPCPKCGKSARFEVTMYSERGVTRGWTFHIGCSACKYHIDRYELELQMSPSGGLSTVKDERQNAILEWNTRAPILSAEEMERLEAAPWSTS